MKSKRGILIVAQNQNREKEYLGVIEFNSETIVDRAIKSEESIETLKLMLQAAGYGSFTTTLDFMWQPYLFENWFALRGDTTNSVFYYYSVPIYTKE